MGNLGSYQKVTTAMKVLGGPRRAGVLVLGGTFLAGATAYAGGQKLIGTLASAIKTRKAPCPMGGRVFEVHSDGEESGGVTLRRGDQYRVLECDGDAILIEVLGDPDSPYFVSGESLRGVSGFPLGAAEKE